MLSNKERDIIIRDAGQACLDWFRDTGYCHLCRYADHDNDGGERHDDECPLRPLDFER